MELMTNMTNWVERFHDRWSIQSTFVCNYKGEYTFTTTDSFSVALQKAIKEQYKHIMNELKKGIGKQGHVTNFFHTFLDHDYINVGNNITAHIIVQAYIHYPNLF